MCRMAEMIYVETRAAVRSKATLSARLMLEQGNMQEKPPVSKLRDREQDLMSCLACSSLSGVEILGLLLTASFASCSSITRSCGC